MRLTQMIGLSLLLSVAHSQTQFITTDLTPYASLDIRTLTNGDLYPSGGQTLSVGGVPMYVAAASELPESLIVVYVGNDGVFRSYDIPVNVRGARTVYTLINNLYGVCDVELGKVEIFGQNGSYASLTLVEGNNIRDHYQGIFCNTLSDTSVFPLEFGEDRSVRLDRQKIELPESFLEDTITFVRFSGQGRYPEGAVFLAALTIEVEGCSASNGDVNRDGCVDDADLLAVLFAFATSDGEADLNCDGSVDNADLEIVLSAFGQNC